MNPPSIIHLANEVDDICKNFLKPRGLSYYHFKRVFKDDSFIILVNQPNLFKMFLESNFIEPTYYVPTYIRQSPVYFWDELLSSELLSHLREQHSLYHGITIISRQKDFYDCTAFAMSEFHPSPSSYYLNILKDLQTFSELFPKMASSLIENVSRKRVKISTSTHNLSSKCFFLPERSARFKIGEGTNDYVTTYEALCLQLLQDGKSYKEIGFILSMSPRTVETHLERLKSRTGLTLGELFLQSFKIGSTRKIDYDFAYAAEDEQHKIKTLRKKSNDK